MRSDCIYEWLWARLGIPSNKRLSMPDIFTLSIELCLSVIRDRMLTSAFFSMKYDSLKVEKEKSREKQSYRIFWLSKKWPGRTHISCRYLDSIPDAVFFTISFVHYLDNRK